MLYVHFLPAFANHGLQALGGLADFIGRILLVVYSINMLLSIGNIFWKSTTLRVLNIIACIPAALVIAVVMNNEPVNALIPIAILIVQCFIISRSVRKKQYTLPEEPANSYLPPDKNDEQHN